MIALGELPPAETPHRVRVTLSAANATVESGEAVSLKASLRPPPEPISPNGFDFGRKAWFDRLGAKGDAIGKIEPARKGAGKPPRHSARLGFHVIASARRHARSARAYTPNAARSRASIRSESAPRRGAEALGAERQIAKPALPSGQAYARDQGASDEAPDPRFDGNPEE